MVRVVLCLGLHRRSDAYLETGLPAISRLKFHPVLRCGAANYIDGQEEFTAAQHIESPRDDELPR